MSCLFNLIDYQYWVGHKSLQCRLDKPAWVGAAPPPLAADPPKLAFSPVASMTVTGTVSSSPNFLAQKLLPIPGGPSSSIG